MILSLIESVSLLISAITTMTTITSMTETETETEFIHTILKPGVFLASRIFFWSNIIYLVHYILFTETIQV